MVERIGFGLYQSCGNMGSVGHMFELQWCRWLGELDQGLDSLCIWQVQVSVYCDWRIPPSSIQSCCTLWISASYRVFVYGRYRKSICLWVVIGPGFVSTSPAFMRSSVFTWPACQNGKLAPHCWGREGST